MIVLVHCYRACVDCGDSSDGDSDNMFVWKRMMLMLNCHSDLEGSD